MQYDAFSMARKSGRGSVDICRMASLATTRCSAGISDLRWARWADRGHAPATRSIRVGAAHHPVGQTAASCDWPEPINKRWWPSPRSGFRKLGPGQHPHSTEDGGYPLHSHSRVLKCRRDLWIGSVISNQVAGCARWSAPTASATDRKPSASSSAASSRLMRGSSGRPSLRKAV